MKHRNTLKLAAVIVISAATAPAFAADPAVPARGPVPFESYDADGNGYVNQEEFNQMRSERIRSRADEQRQFRNMDNAPGFSDLDRNSDGKLNREEIQSHQRERQEIRNENRQQYRDSDRMGGSMGSGAGAGSGRGGMSGGGMGGRR